MDNLRDNLYNVYLIDSQSEGISSDSCDPASKLEVAGSQSAISLQSGEDAGQKLTSE